MPPQARRIGNTDLLTFPLALGVGGLGIGMTEADAFELLDTYAEAGGNTLDTARVYSDWVPGELHRSERILGDWLRARRNRALMIVCTKGGHPDLATMDVPRLDAASLRRDVEGSLKSLRVDTIDLYWLHRDDPTRGVGEIVETLAGFVREGKIRHYGFSNWSAARIREAVRHCGAHGAPAPVGDQSLLNIGCRHMGPLADPTMVVSSRDLDSVDSETGLTAFAYSSQANGFFAKLSKAAAEGGQVPGSSPYDTPANRILFTTIDRHAHALDLSITQVVLGFLLTRRHPTIPIVGPRTMEQLKDTLRAADVRLPSEVFEDLRVQAGF
ncbi:MAG TPA: aldo/keto reductase [Spirochaetia bacterium]|nr:aldo/keto reductase [Spirochaetia bacterium]